MNEKQIELLEEIELFEKLDVKYVLEALRENHWNFLIETVEVELDSDTLDLIKQSLIVLIELDENFTLNFQEALKKVNEYNKVADIDISTANIKQIDLSMIYEMLKKCSFVAYCYPPPSSFDKIPYLLEKIEAIDSEKCMSIDDSVSIDHDNFGNIITGNHNRITLNTSEVNLQQKLKKELENLSIGNMVFNTPEQILFNESEKVTLRISKNSISTDNLPQENKQIEQEIKLSPFMKAKLMSIDFKIMALSEEEQIIDDSDFTEWKWLITANKQKSKGAIYLRITIRIPLTPEKEETKDIPVFEREIDILVK